MDSGACWPAPPFRPLIVLCGRERGGARVGGMDESDAAAPFPAPPEAGLAPSAPPATDQTGPADPPMSPVPMLERADEAGPAAPVADLEPTEALGSEQTRPEPDSATLRPPLAPDRADAFDDGPDETE